MLTTAPVCVWWWWGVTCSVRQAAGWWKRASRAESGCSGVGCTRLCRQSHIYLASWLASQPTHTLRGCTHTHTHTCALSACRRPMISVLLNSSGHPAPRPTHFWLLPLQVLVLTSHGKPEHAHRRSSLMSCGVLHNGCRSCDRFNSAYRNFR